MRLPESSVMEREVDVRWSMAELETGELRLADQMIVPESGWMTAK